MLGYSGNGSCLKYQIQIFYMTDDYDMNKIAIVGWNKSQGMSFTL